MKISELIAALQKDLQILGDLQIEGLYDHATDEFVAFDSVDDLQMEYNSQGRLIKIQLQQKSDGMHAKKQLKNKPKGK